MTFRLLARSISLLTLLLYASQAFPQTNDTFCLAVPLPFPGDTIHLDSERVACIEQLVSSAMADAYKAWKDSIARLVAEKMELHQCYKEPFKEEFTATYTSTEHHYTLYYYDLAGNVIQTIPPAGVHPLSDASFPGGIWNGDEPDHDTLHITRYQYNSVGSLLSQVTPDAGRKEYYYDRAQRLRLSQDAEQKGDNDFAYSRYDGQGRMIETGELSGYTLDITDIADPEFPASGAHTLEESISTTYDQITPPGTIRSMNARGRIASVSNPYMTSWYDYDPHGNIRTLSHLIPSLQDDTVTLRYMYDIRSGNVSEMRYEPDEPDQFVQRFVYDADNRLQEAWSSDDGYVFDQDARYFYYLHGPLARVEYGEDKVQGQDYYYTLQGWIKGLNMPGAEGPGSEPGRDGYVGGHSNLHRYVAHDTMRYALSYHEDDYVPVSGLSLMSDALRYCMDGMASDILGPVGEKGFYGGNIAAMLTDNGVGLQGMAYRYDALHRIKYAGNYLWDTDWTAENTLDMPLVNYDANGNILRHSLKSNTDTDHLRYFYKSGKPNTLDYVADGGVVTGIGAQAPDNYMYDEIGNLLYDASESTSLGWDVYNKLRIVTGGPDGTIHYTYDAQGNRMYKAYDDYTDVYVRDAGGNIIAIYKSGEVSGYETDSLREFHLYGSSRLGIHRINKVAATEAPGGPDLLRTRSERRHKSYELTNHLGNVLTTISDLKQGLDDDMNGIADIYHAGLKSWADYYPFGMEMASRTGVSGNSSRFGFNSKEKDLSMSSLTHYDYGFRVYNPAVGRFLSVDPLVRDFSSFSPFNYVEGNPIRFTDPNGGYKIDPKFAEKYPGLVKLINYVLPQLINNFKVRDAWMQETGLGREKFEEMVTPGKGPWITPIIEGHGTMHGAYYEGPTRTGQVRGGYIDFKDNIFIAPDDVLSKFENSFSIAMQTCDPSCVEEDMFVLSMHILHESAHWGVLQNPNDKLSQRDIHNGGIERGSSFQFRAFKSKFLNYKGNRDDNSTGIYGLLRKGRNIVLGMMSSDLDMLSNESQEAYVPDPNQPKE